MMPMKMMMVDDDYGNESEYPNVQHCVHRSTIRARFEVMVPCELKSACDVRERKCV